MVSKLHKIPILKQVLKKVDRVAEEQGMAMAMKKIVAKIGKDKLVIKNKTEHLDKVLQKKSISNL